MCLQSYRMGAKDREGGFEFEASLGCVCILEFFEKFFR